MEKMWPINDQDGASRQQRGTKKNARGPYPQPPRAARLGHHRVQKQCPRAVQRRRALLLTTAAAGGDAGERAGQGGELVGGEAAEGERGGGPAAGGGGGVCEQLFELRGGGAVG